MIVVCFFLAVPWVSLQFVIVVFPDHTHLLFLVKGISDLPYCQSLYYLCLDVVLKAPIRSAC